MLAASFPTDSLSLNIFISNLLGDQYFHSAVHPNFLRATEMVPCFPEDSLKKNLKHFEENVVSRALVFGILQQQQGKNTKDHRVKFCAGQDCSDVVSSSWSGQKTSAQLLRPLYRFSGSLPDLKELGTCSSWERSNQAQLSEDTAHDSGTPAMSSLSTDTHFSPSLPFLAVHWSFQCLAKKTPSLILMLHTIPTHHFPHGFNGVRSDYNEIHAVWCATRMSLTFSMY